MKDLPEIGQIVTIGKAAAKHEVLQVLPINKTTGGPSALLSFPGEPCWWPVSELNPVDENQAELF